MGGFLSNVGLGGGGGGISLTNPFPSAGGSSLVRPGQTTSPGGGPAVNPPLPIPDWATPGLLDNLLALLGVKKNQNDPTTGSTQVSQKVGEELRAFLGANLPTILGSLQGQNQFDWFKNTGVDILNNLRGQQGQAQGQTLDLQSQYLPQMLKLLGGQQDFATGQQSDLAARLGNANNFLGQAFYSPTDLSRVPGLRDVMNFTGSAANTGANTLGALLESLGGGGQLQRGIGTAQDFAGGQNPLFGAITGVGNQLTQAGGQTPFTSALQGAGLSTLANYGMTPQIQGLLGTASGLLGGDPSNREAMQRALETIRGNPLLPTDQVVSMARNQAATDAGNQMEALKRQLLGRTGITGPATAGGGTSELLKEFGDSALQSTSKATMDALMGQQALGLNQWGQGAGLFGTAQQGKLGQQGQGLDAIMSALGLAAGRETGVPGLTLGGGNLDLNRILGGAGLYGNALEGQLGGLGALTGLLGQQNAGFGQASNLLSSLNQLAGTQQQNVFGLQDLGLKSSSNMYDALANLLNLQGNQVGQGFTNTFNAANYPANAQQNWMDLLKSATGGQTGIFGAPQQGSPLGAGISQLSQWGGIAPTKKED